MHPTRALRSHLKIIGTCEEGETGEEKREESRGQRVRRKGETGDERGEKQSQS